MNEAQAMQPYAVQLDNLRRRVSALERRPDADQKVKAELVDLVHKARAERDEWKAKAETPPGNPQHIRVLTPWGPMAADQLIELAEKAKASEAELKRKLAVVERAENIRIAQLEQSNRELRFKYDALVASAQKLHVVVQGDEFRIEPRKEAERSAAIRDSFIRSAQDTFRQGVATEEVKWAGLDLSCAGVLR